jgi:hypothetical protein
MSATPGPWEFDRESGEFVADAKIVMRARVFPNAADRLLIAAAPDLLAACVAAREAIELVHGGDGWTALPLLVAAIERAGGVPS